MRCGAQEEEKLAVASSSKAASRFAYDVLQAGGEGGDGAKSGAGAAGGGNAKRGKDGHVQLGGGADDFFAKPPAGGSKGGSMSRCARQLCTLDPKNLYPLHAGFRLVSPSDSHLVWCQHDCMHGFPAGACMRCLHTLS